MARMELVASLVVPWSARQSRKPSTPYSKRCPVCLIAPITSSTPKEPSNLSGTIGARAARTECRVPEVLDWEATSVESTAMTPSQISTGSQ